LIALKQGVNSVAFRLVTLEVNTIKRATASWLPFGQTGAPGLPCEKTRMMTHGRSALNVALSAGLVNLELTRFRGHLVTTVLV
jgi:hypothetical protein